MARGRYAQQDTVDTAHYGTYDKRIESGGYIDTDLLAGIRSFEYTLRHGERLDVLASRFLHDDGYWWLLALINDITYPLGLAAGTVIRIPYDVKEVLKKISL